MKNLTIKTLFLLLGCILQTELKAQLVNLGFPLNPGESNYYSRYNACNSGNDLWVVMHVYDTTDTKNHLKIVKNNGIFWTEYFNDTCAYGDYGDITTCFYNSDLYFGISSTNFHLNGVTYPKCNAIYKWNGSAVSFVDSVNGTILAMDTFNGKLMIMGNFSKIGTNAISGLAEYNGSSWSSCGTPANWVNFQPGFGHKTSQMVNQGKKLYLVAQYSFVNGSKPQYYGLAVYDGTNISPVPSAEFTNSSFLLGEIYAHPDSTKYYSNDSAHKTFYCESGKSRITINNNKIGYQYQTNANRFFAYRAGSIYTLKATTDGPYYSTNAFIEKLTGSKKKKIYIPDNIFYDGYRMVGIFGKEKVFLTIGETGNVNFYRLDSNENLTAGITGKVAMDINNNGILDYTDMPLKNIWVQTNSGSKVKLTDANGDYNAFRLASGRYVTEVLKPKNKIFINPANGKYTDSLSPDSNIIRDFLLDIDSSYRDISIELSAQLGWRVRRGFTENYTLKITNNSAFTKSGSVKLKWDNIYYGASSSDTNFKTNGSGILYTFKNLGMDESITVKFYLASNFNGTLANYYKIFAELDSTNCSWDTDSSNNADTLNLYLVASCDPNDKSSNPSGDIVKGTKEINYHINFQNVGNDTAYRVVVVDTLDMRLPMESVILKTSSHKYSLRVVDNILIFEFKDIKLVDSSTNQEGSKGFLRFSVNLDPKLNVGAKVHNRAHIYFDYNEAVITNVASVVIVDPKESISELNPIQNTLKLYPNPTTDMITILNIMEECRYNIYSITGAVVAEGRAMAGENVIKIANIQAGVYFIVLDNGLRAKFIIH